MRVERGFVKPEDQLQGGLGDDSASGPGDTTRSTGSDGEPVKAQDDAEGAEEASALRPLPDRLVSDLTAWRTLALQDRVAQDPALAFAAVLHVLVLGCFYSFSRECCVQIAANRVSFSNAPGDLRDCAPAQAIDARAAAWKERLPQSDKEVWSFLLTLDGEEQSQLLAHCVSLCVNAQAEVVPKYDNGRISAHGVERRIAHSHILALAAGLDVHGAGWRPTAAGYFSGVTKPQILADVAEARGDEAARMIGHLKKADMAREAERLVEETTWLPAPMRTPGMDDIDPDGGKTAVPVDADEGDPGVAELPVAAE